MGFERAAALVVAHCHGGLVSFAQRPDEPEHLAGVAVGQDEEGEHGAQATRRYTLP